MEILCRPSPEAAKAVGDGLWMYILVHMLLLLREYFGGISL